MEAPKRANVKSSIGSGHVNIENRSALHPASCNSNIYELEAFYMPALQNVPLLWNVDDYKVKVVCDLKTTQFPGNVKYDVGFNWDQADKLILDQDEIGPRLNDKSKFKEELAASGIAEISDEYTRICAAVRFLA